MEEATDGWIERKTGLLFLFVYLAIAWSVGDLYPFTTLPMYQGNSSLPAQRLLVVGVSEKTWRPDELKDLECARVSSKSGRSCPPGQVWMEDGAVVDAYHIPYLDREVEGLITRFTDSAMPNPQFRVIRRTWLSEGSTHTLRYRDCVVHQCREVSE